MFSRRALSFLVSRAKEAARTETSTSQGLNFARASRSLCSSPSQHDKAAKLIQSQHHHQKTKKKNTFYVTSLGAVVLGLGYGLAGYGFYDKYNKKDAGANGDEPIVNWSGTHSCTPLKLHQPETLEEVQRLVEKCHAQGRKLRPVGNALSPNGIGLSNDEMVSLAMLDKVISVDTRKKQVRVQTGCSVGELCKELRKHGLVLENLASIAEQQVGGFIQIGAHGTGAEVPPVEMQCIEMQIVTPKEGTLTVKREDGEIFQMLQSGLGMFGIVTEVTLQCVSSHKLLEHTFTLSKDEVEAKHRDLIRKHKHVRYHWIPYTNDVVVTTCDNYTLWNKLGLGMNKNSISQEERLEPLRRLLVEAGGKSLDELQGLSFADLRTMLLEDKPLDVDHIKRVNNAEAEFWKRSEGYRIGYSDEILQFDCGGQQWVLEMAIHAGTVEKPSFSDIEFMKRLLDEIESKGLPAPAPIEQRWTASSASRLSPASWRACSPSSLKACSTHPQDSIFSWIGIIMYLPLNDLKTRAEVTDRFKAYCSLMRGVLQGETPDAQEHWAKIELPENAEEKREMVRRIRSRYPWAKVKELRERFDPKNILGNELLDTLFG